jgi:hypothetical protein
MNKNVAFKTPRTPKKVDFALINKLFAIDK